MKNVQRTKEEVLEAWMHLLSSDAPEVQAQIAKRYPVFREIYDEIETFRQDIGGVLNMFSDALKIMDRNTVQLMIDEMQEKLAGTMDELEEAKGKLEGTKEELEGTKGKVQELTGELEQQTRALEEKQDELERKNERIKELERLLMESGLSGS